MTLQRGDLNQASARGVSLGLHSAFSFEASGLVGPFARRVRRFAGAQRRISSRRCPRFSLAPLPLELLPVSLPLVALELAHLKIGRRRGQRSPRAVLLLLHFEPQLALLMIAFPHKALHVA